MFDELFFHSWNEVARTAVAGALAYVTLVIFLRISGKRTLSKLNAFDLVVTVALGSILGSILLNRSIALAEGAAAMAVLILLQFIVSALSVRSKAFAKFVRASPSTLVDNGSWRQDVMRSERITQGEVLSAIRENGGRGVEDARWVVLEGDGTLSVSLSR